MSEQTKDNMLCGAKLRAKRELVGLTVEELANECGCDWRDVRSLEEPWRGVAVSDDVAVAVGVCLAAFDDIGVSTSLYYPAEDEGLHAMRTKLRTMGDIE